MTAELLFLPFQPLILTICKIFFQNCVPDVQLPDASARREIIEILLKPPAQPSLLQAPAILSAEVKMESLRVESQVSLITAMIVSHI